MADAFNTQSNINSIILPECIVIWLLNSVLIVGFAIVYRRVQLGSQITLIKRICVFLIIANIGGILWSVLYYLNRSQTLETGVDATHTSIIIVFASIALAFQDFFFFLAHWVFAIQYFAMSRNFPLLKANQDTTQNDIKFQAIKRNFIIFILVCVLLSQTFYGISNYQDFLNNKVGSTGFTAAFIFSYQLLALINLIIYITMMAALRGINRIINENNDALLLDKKAFLLHILSFTLFIVSF